MRNIHNIWKRPINLVTVMDNEPHLFRFDGKEYTKHNLNSKAGGTSSGDDADKGETSD